MAISVPGGVTHVNIRGEVKYDNGMEWNFQSAHKLAPMFYDIIVELCFIISDKREV